MTRESDAEPSGIDLLVSLKVGGIVYPRLKQEYARRNINELCALEAEGVEVLDGLGVVVDRLPGLIEEAAHDQIAFTALSRIAVLMLRQQTALPAQLSNWLAGVTEGSTTLPPAGRRGTHPAENFARDLSLCMEIARQCRDEGLRPTRSDASEPTSACDVVAKRHGMSFASVKKIWNRYSHLRPVGKNSVPNK